VNELRGLQRFGVLIPLYLLLLVVLSLVGTNNRQLLAEQVDLLDTKQLLLANVAVERRDAAVINGPAAAAEWAVSNGMVPVPEARAATLVAPSEAPTLDYPTTSLELRTVWR